VSGKNIFPGIYGSTSFRDIHVSDEGLVLAVDANGRIYEYDLHGTLLFLFGAQDVGDQRLGTLRNPTAIERYEDYLYVLDKDKNAIVVYQTTDFAQIVHDGVRLYMEGYYQEAKPYFEQVLDYNGSFIMAYQAIADAYYKERDYSNALASYRYAEDRDGIHRHSGGTTQCCYPGIFDQILLVLIGLSLGQTVVKRLTVGMDGFIPPGSGFEVCKDRWMTLFQVQVYQATFRQFLLHQEKSTGQLTLCDAVIYLGGRGQGPFAVPHRVYF
jgi:tetratricopeptide (TPR) repeat protein